MEAVIWKVTEAQQELALELVINTPSVGQDTNTNVYRTFR